VDLWIKELEKHADDVIKVLCAKSKFLTRQPKQPPRLIEAGARPLNAASVLNAEALKVVIDKHVRNVT